jgi:lantibiotic modifying enzyme
MESAFAALFLLEEEKLLKYQKENGYDQRKAVFHNRTRYQELLKNDTTPPVLFSFARMG